MILGQELPSGHTVFCDDIRTENNGKHLLIGAYSGGMTINLVPPVDLPQISCFVVIRFAYSSLPTVVPVRIIKDVLGREELLYEHVLNVPAATEPSPALEPDNVPFLEARIPIHVWGVQVSEPCRIKVRAFINGDELRLGSLSIQFNSVI